MPESNTARRSLLLVSYHFPPFNTIAAIRIGKLARFLLERGWDIGVLSAVGDEPETLQIEIDPAIVTRTGWYDVDKTLHPFFPNWVRNLVRRAIDQSSESVQGAPPHQSESLWRLSLRRIHAGMVRWPDKRAGWRRRAVEAGSAIMAQWKPDLIYASAPPFTSLLVADDLSRRFGVPWVAEFRDLWVDDPYYQFGALRKSIERIWEKRLIGRAAALVVVAPQGREMLGRRYDKPITTIMNGYDPDDFMHSPKPTPSPSGPLRILFTGHIYAGYRDPTPLFKAMGLLGPERAGLCVEFVGSNTESVMALARDAGVEEHVSARGPVPYQDSLAMQMSADVLLHLQWNNPKEAGVIPGKLFEYIGAQRPILGIGYATGSVAKIITERQAGLVSNDPATIAAQLRSWLDAKKSGGVAPLPAGAAVGLTRSEQYAKLAEFLNRLTVERRDFRRRHADRAASADAFGFRATRFFEVANMQGLERPRLVVIIDTEEEFDWDQPFSRQNRGVESLRSLHRAQSIFKKWGIVPTYVVDYPVVKSDFGRRQILEWLDSGACEIGAHLHPWVNPPEEEVIGNRNSFPGNLPAELERAKLSMLTAEIEENFGKRPVIYRAGRYGLGPSSLSILEDLGYMVDLSVVPFTSFAANEGPDYTAFGTDPLWFGDRRRMLELPVTRAFVGRMRKLNPRTFDRLAEGIAGRLRVAGILSRAGLLQRVMLTPEGVRLDEMRRLCDSLVEAGQRVFTLSFHAPSLRPGNTTYVRTTDDLAVFLETLDQFFSYFRSELHGEFASPIEIYKLLDQRTDFEAASQGATL